MLAASGASLAGGFGIQIRCSFPLAERMKNKPSIAWRELSRPGQLFGLNRIADWFLAPLSVRMTVEVSTSGSQKTDVSSALLSGSAGKSQPPAGIEGRSAIAGSDAESGFVVAPIIRIAPQEFPGEVGKGEAGDILVRSGGPPIRLWHSVSRVPGFDRFLAVRRQMPTTAMCRFGSILFCD